jgi:uncharacterized damage-inducible protein DinB
MADLRYPIGKLQIPDQVTSDKRNIMIDEIYALPTQVRDAVKDLTAEQLDTEYRPGGWSIRQVTHHLPDSHINAYIRFKLALTEDSPVIKPYDEQSWAELLDSRDTPLEVSVQLLESLHGRWVVLLRSMNDSDFERTYRHPEMGTLRLDQVLSLYAWHGKHHLAHITSLRGRNLW